MSGPAVDCDALGATRREVEHGDVGRPLVREIAIDLEGFWAIEVTNTKRVRSTDTRALRAFRQDYPECQPLVLYRGQDRALVDGVLTMPVAQFLRGLVPGRPLPGQAAARGVGMPELTSGAS